MPKTDTVNQVYVNIDGNNTWRAVNDILYYTGGAWRPLTYGYILQSGYQTHFWEGGYDYIVNTGQGVIKDTPSANIYGFEVPSSHPSTGGVFTVIGVGSVDTDGTPSISRLVYSPLQNTSSLTFAYNANYQGVVQLTNLTTNATATISTSRNRIDSSLSNYTLYQFSQQVIHDIIKDAATNGQQIGIRIS